MTNILFLMTDQQRWDAMSSSGTWVNTPNLDRIAAEGVRFSNCITTTPICVPARLTLATGLYPHNNAVWTNLPYTMPADADNWMRELKKLGYRTSLFGKTHLHPHSGISTAELRRAGDWSGTRFDLRDKEDLLHAWGLDDVNEIGGPRASARVLSHMTAMWQDKGLLQAYRDDFAERFSNKPHVVRPSVLPLEDYADVYVAQQAKHYLQSYDRQEPWFCWVSFGGPHEPWDAPEPYASMYDPREMPLPADQDDDGPRPQGMLDRLRRSKETCPDFEDGEVAAMRANYAGNVTLIDDQIGELLALLEARGWLDDTIIAFTSDHGEMNGDHDLIYKMNFYDGALRVPLIVRAPGSGQAGLVNDCLVENSDLGPTLVELAGGDISYPQFARSLTGALAGGRHREDVISEFMGEIMLMDETWKVAINREGDSYMLFNREGDPNERQNLAGRPDYKAQGDALRLKILDRIMQSQLRSPVS